MNWIIYGLLAVITIVVCDISRKHLSNKNLLREIYVPKKIINFVIQ